MQENYECETYTILYAFYEQDHFTLYLKNNNTEEVFNQSFTFDSLSTQYFFFILKLLGEPWETQQFAMQEANVDLVVKDEKKAIAFVDGNDFMLIDKNDYQNPYLRAQVENAIASRRAR